MTMFGDLFGMQTTHLAVVPIVVNAGAALLPAILAGIGSCIALLFKPRELARVCRERPIVLGILIVVPVGIWGILRMLPDRQGPQGLRQRTVGTSPSGALGLPITVDWTRIALARIEARALGGSRSVMPSAPPVTAPLDRPFIFRGGPRRLGVVGDDITGKLGLAWRYYPQWVDDAGVSQEDTDAMILSSPAVHGDRLYAASCLLDPPDNFGAVFCLDAATGRQIWSIDSIDGDYIKGFFSSPAVTADGRYLLIGQGLHPDAHCRLICIDTQAGRIHWTVEVALHIESSPAIVDDVVYVGCGAIEDPVSHKALSHPGFVLAVRISDGQELWRYDVKDPESSPAIQDGVLYVGSGFNGQAVVALRTDVEADLRAKGLDRLLWKADAPYPITGAITLVNDTVIAGGGNGDFVYRDPNPAGVVLALDAASGKVRWQTAMPDAVLGAIAAGKYLICPVANGRVVALNSQNGAEVWNAQISGNAPVLAAPAVTERHVYAVSHDGYLARLDLDTGRIIEKVYVNAPECPGEQGLSISSPLVAHGRLFIGSETGGLRCYCQGNEP